MRTVLLAGGLFVAILTAAAPAVAAPVADKDLCKAGGYASYIDPKTDLPFQNQGRCVSFVNGGCTLVPVQDEPPVPVAPTARMTLESFQVSSGTFVVRVEVQGQPNSVYPIGGQRGSEP